MIKTIKQLVLVLILGTCLYNCSSTKTIDSTQSTAANDTLRIANDSLEYEIIIIEPGFNAWLVTQPPRGFYGQQFLEIRNRQYVVEFNQRVLQPQRYNPNLYIQQINYNPNIDYGYEVNYLLYNYFLYFEQRYKQKFVTSRG
ncbi:DUF6146 family protein [Aquimarina brevivitae]|uniref:Lipoprotein n=1 Tax=Aquimarina brevivitae TaxID=323412 RepID=A0A4Q7P1E2_9FLAO|nr:DUF6146 family protein [Aquimarina brevivitae]RZS93656.1 hypothetical protein EV197_2236 [Aquimarina brevivitae]